MKTIGIIGGLGPPSTIEYYKGLTEGSQQRLGGNNAVKIILTSVNGEDIKGFRLSGDSQAEGAFYANEAKRLEQAGADFILIASNTSHRNAAFVESAVSIPLLHLAKITAGHIHALGIKKIGLLGTAPTMEEDFYKAHFTARGLDVLVPDPQDRTHLSALIYNELTQHRLSPAINDAFVTVAKKLQQQGAEGIILGCTELTLLDFSSLTVPLFDTVKIHIAAALDEALS